MKFDLSFEQIFENEGLYRAETFADGVAFQIKKSITGDLELFVVEYKNVQDFSPKIIDYRVNKSVVGKKYSLILNRGQLFGHYTVQSIIDESNEANKIKK